MTICNSLHGYSSNTLSRNSGNTLYSQIIGNTLFCHIGKILHCQNDKTLCEAHIIWLVRIVTSYFVSIDIFPSNKGNFLPCQNGKMFPGQNCNILRGQNGNICSLLRIGSSFLV